ncbi:unnamed protein product [Adineta steineri]|uniref:F-box domain-containing protein n=1 Tax=Adineta steineri TaxID=433720 RepID=A0A814R669_9BILA|nr:unnamed protein product [Adineta steineri]CAF1310778.1 unnamed protein product [Adineta steineri]
MAYIEDLPDELLIMIWNKLNNLDVFYSFIGVNKRFDKLIRDINYTRSIQLIDKDSNHKYCSLSDPLLNKLCSYFLPQIHENIECLTLEPYSMERILCAAQYPHLYKLILVNFGHQSTRHYFIDQSPFLNLFKQNITHLNVSIDDSKLKLLLVNDNENLYAFISSIFTSLIDFTFTCHGFWRRYAHLTIDNSCQTNSFLQNVVNLCIDVDTLDDCLRLLDGRLIYLRKLIVNIYKITSATFDIDNKTLLNIRCFSLTSSKSTSEYDNSILPLVHRMIYLEKLTLCLSVHRISTFIDGFHFKNEIFRHLPQLLTFDFEITTFVESIEQTNYESENTFIDTRYNQAIFYIDCDPYGGARSHLFSLPYTINETLHLSSNFPGASLSNVRSLTLIDMHYSFEHQFFIKIAQSFPYLTDLCICNQEPQQYKQLNQSSIIEFPYLNNLTFILSHIDYPEHFLVDKNIILPHLIYLVISYEHLKIVTENFTRDTTRRNCAQLNCICVNESIVHSESFYQYFPSLK